MESRDAGLLPPKTLQMGPLISTSILAVSRFFDSLAALFQGTYPEISSGGRPQLSYPQFPSVCSKRANLKTGWVDTDRMAEWYRASSSGSVDLGFDSKSGQTNDLRIGIHSAVSSLFEIEKALGIASLHLKVRTSRNQKQKSLISARACIFKRSHKKGTD